MGKKGRKPKEVEGRVYKYVKNPKTGKYVKIKKKTGKIVAQVTESRIPKKKR